MKSKIRIKICQETTKSKQLRSMAIITDNKRSFEIKEMLKETDKKIEFLKKLSNYL